MPGEDLLALPAEERAREGVFLGFQYPVEIPGVNNTYLLRAALNAARRHRGQSEVDAFDFLETCVQGTHALMKMDEILPVARRQRGLLRRREEAQRDPADAGAGAAASPCSTKPIPASTSTP